MTTNTNTVKNPCCTFCGKEALPDGENEWKCTVDRDNPVDNEKHKWFDLGNIKRLYVKGLHVCTDTEKNKTWYNSSDENYEVENVVTLDRQILSSFQNFKILK